MNSIATGYQNSRYSKEYQETTAKKKSNKRMIRIVIKSERVVKNEY